MMRARVHTTSRNSDREKNTINKKLFRLHLGIVARCQANMENVHLNTVSFLSVSSVSFNFQLRCERMVSRVSDDLPFLNFSQLNFVSFQKFVIHPLQRQINGRSTSFQIERRIYSISFLIQFCVSLSVPFIRHFGFLRRLSNNLGTHPSAKPSIRRCSSM